MLKRLALSLSEKGTCSRIVFVHSKLQSVYERVYVTMKLPAANSIRLRPETDALPALVCFLEKFGEANAIGSADAMALALALEELFTNTVSHGKTTGVGETVSVSLSLKTDALTVIYSDRGIQFDTTLGEGTTPSDHACNVAHMPIGGLGLHFIRRTMQEVAYSRKSGRNITTMVRRLGVTRVAHELA
jgi:serine/threonine-protein kinase RsbW